MQKGLTKKGEIIKGFKATDEDMKCRGFQFEMDKWFEYKGDIELCESGFHFCEYPSGPWSYYTTGRLFEVEAEYVLKSTGPGSDLKHVCKRIRFVKEIVIEGDSNTGDYNTGNDNTGDYNTGNRNTGNRNTGNDNTGDYNTGNRNTGNRNTGNDNTGDYNTGDYNTGNRNTGYYNTGYHNTGNRNTGSANTGYYNTGYHNTGDYNTGDGNCCDYSSGFFNTKETIIIFDEIVELSRDELDLALFYALSQNLSSDIVFDYSKFLAIPGATLEKIEKLHHMHIQKRKEFRA